MGKGPDQGDFETPTVDASSPAAPWPTEPATEPGVGGDDETTSPTAPGDGDATTTAATVQDEGPGDVGQLPTTSGSDPAVALVAVAAAATLVACGAVMALRHRKRPDW